MRLQVFVKTLNFPSFSVNSMWMMKYPDKTSATLLLWTSAVHFVAMALKKLPNKACLYQDVKRNETANLCPFTSKQNHSNEPNHLWIITRIKITHESSYHNHNMMIRITIRQPSEYLIIAMLRNTIYVKKGKKWNLLIHLLSTVLSNVIFVFLTAHT